MITQHNRSRPFNRFRQLLSAAATQMEEITAATRLEGSDPGLPIQETGAATRLEGSDPGLPIQETGAATRLEGSDPGLPIQETGAATRLEGSDPGLPIQETGAATRLEGSDPGLPIQETGAATRLEGSDPGLPIQETGDSSKSVNENAGDATGDSSMNYKLKEKNTLVKNQESGSKKPQVAKKKDPKNKRSSDDPVLLTNKFKTEFGPLENLILLGKGFFGKVYEAIDRLDGTKYAVKRIQANVKDIYLVTEDLGKDHYRVRLGKNPKFRKLLREVESLQQLRQHKNIVRYVDSWLETDSSDSASSGTHGNKESSGSDKSTESGSSIEVVLCIKMELCSRDLRKWLDDREKKSGQLEMDGEAIRIFKEIVEGLKFCHGMNIMHRDLKPENIFLTCEDKEKIGDFGRSKNVLDGIREKLSVSDARVLKHTPPRKNNYYTAPEFCKVSGYAFYNYKVDIYSLGIILFEMCNNFGSNNKTKEAIELLRKTGKCSDDFRQHNRVAAALIEKMIHEDPEQRPTTEEILNDEIFLSESDCDRKQPNKVTEMRGIDQSQKDDEALPVNNKAGKMHEEATSVNPGAGDATAAERLHISRDTANSDSFPIPDMLGLKIKD